MSEKQQLGRYLVELFRHQLEIKMYHFQTKHYGAHKATDAYLVKYLLNQDQLLEVAQGIFGQVTIGKISLNFSTLTDKNAKAGIDRFLKVLEQMQGHYESYPEITAVLDVLMADAQQLKYLLLFK